MYTKNMDTVLELLQITVSDVVKETVEKIAPVLPKIADTTAIKILSEIKKIIGDDEL